MEESASCNLSRPIYIIWSKLGKTPPKKVYMSYDVASKVADKMARKHPDQRFFVMKSEKSFKLENEECKFRDYKMRNSRDAAVEAMTKYIAELEETIKVLTE